MIFKFSTHPTNRAIHKESILPCSLHLNTIMRSIHTWCHSYYWNINAQEQLRYRSLPISLWNFSPLEASYVCHGFFQYILHPFRIQDLVCLWRFASNPSQHSRIAETKPRGLCASNSVQPTAYTTDHVYRLIRFVPWIIVCSARLWRQNIHRR